MGITRAIAAAASECGSYVNKDNVTVSKLCTSTAASAIAPTGVAVIASLGALVVLVAVVAFSCVAYKYYKEHRHSPRVIPTAGNDPLEF